MKQLKVRLHRTASRKLLLAIGVTLSAAAHAVPVSRAIGLPITFERNDGQFPAEVTYASTGPRGTLLLRAGEIAITPRSAGAAAAPLALRMRDANPSPEMEARQPLATRSHYYTGAQPIENVPHFGELRMKDVYPGIDVVLHGRDGALEYDFVVAPHADPRDIRLDLRGLHHAGIDMHGNLRFERDGQVLEQHAPVAYQDEGGARHSIEAHFEIVQGDAGREAQIVVGTYDDRLPLTVDPVLAYSTYSGGNGNGAGGTSVRVDRAGRLYFTSLTSFSESPTLNCLDPSTNTLVYQTHLGGLATTIANSIALGGAGLDIAYVAGSTRDPAFPVRHTPALEDAFVAAFTADGRLAGGALLAGNNFDSASSVATDPEGNIYVAGSTLSADFPKTTGQLMNVESSDAFVAKFTSSFALVYSRLLGGINEDNATAIAVDTTGHAVVVGRTFSLDFPVVNAKPPLSPGPVFPPGSTDFTYRSFATRLSSDGSTLLYSQFIGGQARSPNGVAIDPTNGDAVVVGDIQNGDLIPASIAPYGGFNEAFVLRLDPTGVPTWATLLGGSDFDFGAAVAVDAIGDVYVTGSTASANFPVVNPLAEGASNRGLYDAFLTRFRDGKLDFSTYLGGNDAETSVALALAPDGGVWVSGFTPSSDFPVANALHSTRTASGGIEGFLSKVSGFDAPNALLNISTRAHVFTGNDVMIGGFVVSGSANKTVVVTATGPSLAPVGIANPLPNPTLTLVRSIDQAVIASNDDWGTAPNAEQIQAAGFAPADSHESAIMMSLPPGAYTAIVSDAAGAEGVGIVAAYEVDHPEVPFLNISTRAQVGTGNDVVIGGFVVEGSTPRTVVVTGTGPSLSASGIANPLANPTLTLVRSSDQAVIATNDDWGSAPNASAIQAAGFAPVDPKESAIMVTLPPGAYTAILSGAAGGTGVGIVAVYAIP